MNVYICKILILKSPVMLQLVLLMLMPFFDFDKNLCST